MIKLFSLSFILLIFQLSSAQRFPNTGYKVEVKPMEKVTIYFDRPLCNWDGFGVNYVETCQTRDYSKFQQDYSGFSFATPETREKILDLIFAKDGLKPGLTKLFLDPFHEGITKDGNDNNDPLEINMNGFDHETTTRWMRYFNREGLKRMQSWGGRLTAIATLYGPAPWMTKQKWVLGRDIDPDEKYEIAEYMASWAKFLLEKEKINVRYFSFHNEGDAYYRWPRDGSNPGEDHRDYNMYWPSEQVADFLKLSREVFDTNGLKDVGLTPGETQSWFRFDAWGYASALVSDSVALKNLALLTSHSFTVPDQPGSVYYGDFRSTGQDLVNEVKPGIKSWITSRPWTQDVFFVENIRRDIYECKVSGLIPWAPISGSNQWMESNGEYSDGSMKAAFSIHEDGSFDINKGYYFFKQISRAGQPGMKVAQVVCLDPSLGAIAFSSEKTKNPDSFVILNKSDKTKEVEICINGSKDKNFEAFRTSETDEYISLGSFSCQSGMIRYKAPARSATTFFGIYEP